MSLGRETPAHIEILGRSEHPLRRPPDDDRVNPNSSFLVRRRRRLTVVVAAASLSLVAASCGGSDDSTSQVASLGTLATDSSSGDGAATGDSVGAADTQEAVLAYASCMRENGVDMDDPTFDADGNMQGGLGFGPDSGIDPQSDEFQAAQEACGDLIDGIALGGPGGGNGVDQEAVQTALTDFTACLRDEGLDVDDITFGPGGGGPGGAAGAPDGSFPAAPDGSVPGGFADSGDGSGPPAGGAAPDGEGFDPTSRMIEQLGLDESDPAVTAALEVCQPVLESAFQPTTTEAGA